MNCARCNSTQLEPRRIFRLSGCLVALGFFLLAYAGAAIMGGIVLTVAGTAITGVAGKEAMDKARQEGLTRLKQDPDLPPSVVRDFENDGVIDDSEMNKLTPDQRRRVQEIQAQYIVSAGGAAAAVGCVGCLGGLGVIVLFVSSIPALIVGLLLILKKSVWHCVACTSVFDRA